MSEIEKKLFSGEFHKFLIQTRLMKEKRVTRFPEKAQWADKAAPKEGAGVPGVPEAKLFADAHRVAAFDKDEMLVHIMRAVISDHCYYKTLPTFISSAEAREAPLQGNRVSFVDTFDAAVASGRTELVEQLVGMTELPVRRNLSLLASQKAQALQGNIVVTRSHGRSAAHVSLGLNDRAKETVKETASQVAVGVGTGTCGGVGVGVGVAAGGGVDAGVVGVVGEGGNANVAKAEDDSVTRCICELTHDDGFMICCDKCSVWQHVDCMDVDRENIPDEYWCELCVPRVLDKARARSLQLLKCREEARYHSSLVVLESAPVASVAPLLPPPPPPPKKKRASRKRTGSRKTKEAASRQPRQYTRPQASTPKRRVRGNHDLYRGNMNYEANRRNWVLNYQQADTNHYSPELRARFRSIQRQPALAEATVRSANMSLSKYDKMVFKATTAPHGKGKILISNCNIESKSPIVELLGKYMMGDKFKTQNLISNINNPTYGNCDFVNIPGPFVFFYQLPGKASMNHHALANDAVVVAVKKREPDYFNGTEICVDARTYGNVARYARRSCQPNAQIQHLYERGVVRFFIVALKNIRIMTEITIAHERHDLLALSMKDTVNFTVRPTSTLCACGLPNECLFGPQLQQDAGAFTPAPQSGESIPVPIANIQSLSYVEQQRQFFWLLQLLPHQKQELQERLQKQLQQQQKMNAEQMLIAEHMKLLASLPAPLSLPLSEREHNISDAARENPDAGTEADTANANGHPCTHTHASSSKPVLRRRAKSRAYQSLRAHRKLSRDSRKIKSVLRTIENMDKPKQRRQARRATSSRRRSSIVAAPAGSPGRRGSKQTIWSPKPPVRQWQRRHCRSQDADDESADVDVEADYMEAVNVFSNDNNIDRADSGGHVQRVPYAHDDNDQLTEFASPDRAVDDDDDVIEVVELDEDKDDSTDDKDDSDDDKDDSADDDNNDNDYDDVMGGDMDDADEVIEVIDVIEVIEVDDDDDMEDIAEEIALPQPTYSEDVDKENTSPQRSADAAMLLQERARQIVLMPPPVLSRPTPALPHKCYGPAPKRSKLLRAANLGIQSGTAALPALNVNAPRHPPALNPSAPARPSTPQELHAVQLVMRKQCQASRATQQIIADPGAATAISKPPQPANANDKVLFVQVQKSKPNPVAAPAPLPPKAVPQQCRQILAPKPLHTHNSNVPCSASAAPELQQRRKFVISNSGQITPAISTKLLAAPKTLRHQQRTVPANATHRPLAPKYVITKCSTGDRQGSQQKIYYDESVPKFVTVANPVQPSTGANGSTSAAKQQPEPSKRSTAPAIKATQFDRPVAVGVVKRVNGQNVHIYGPANGVIYPLYRHD